MTGTTRSIAVLAIVAVAALAASFGAPASAHALPSQATLEITKDPDKPGKYIVHVEGVIGAASVAQAQEWWTEPYADGKMRVDVMGNDTIVNDYLFTFTGFGPMPTIAGLPFNITRYGVPGAQLNEDDYAGNRRDEIYAAINRADYHGGHTKKDVPTVKTNTVVGYF